MKKLFRAKLKGPGHEFRTITEQATRVRLVDAGLVEERGASSPRACLAFAALSVWNRIGEKLAGIVELIFVDYRGSRTDGGRLTPETAHTIREEE